MASQSLLKRGNRSLHLHRSLAELWWASALWRVKSRGSWLEKYANLSFFEPDLCTQDLCVCTPQCPTWYKVARLECWVQECPPAIVGISELIPVSNVITYKHWASKDDH